MPRGSKDAYTDKQKRQAEHIEEGYLDAGVPADEAAARAWATVNRQDHGGKKSGSGRGKSRDTQPAAKRASTAAKTTTRAKTKTTTAAKRPTRAKSKTTNAAKKTTTASRKSSKRRTDG